MGFRSTLLNRTTEVEEEEEEEVLFSKQDWQSRGRSVDLRLSNGVRREARRLREINPIPLPSHRGDVSQKLCKAENRWKPLRLLGCRSLFWSFQGSRLVN